MGAGVHIRAREGIVTMMGPDASARYLYERELPESGLDLRLCYSPEKQYDYRLGTIDTVLIELEVSHDGGGTRLHKSWGRDFTSSESLDGLPNTYKLQLLDMSFEEVAQTKLEDFQSIVDELDRVYDASDAIEKLQDIAESNDLQLLAEEF